MGKGETPFETPAEPRFDKINLEYPNPAGCGIMILSHFGGRVEMRRIISILAILCLLFSFTACTDPSEPSAPMGAESSSVVQSSEESRIEDNISSDLPSEIPSSKVTVEEDNSPTVYVSRTGYCYPSNPYCSNMQSPLVMTEKQAIKRGRSACQNCY